MSSSVTPSASRRIVSTAAAVWVISALRCTVVPPDGAFAPWAPPASGGQSRRPRRASRTRARVGQAATARRACATSSGGPAAVDDRIAPVVEADPLGQQLGAEPVAVAGDRVEAQSRRSCRAVTVRAGRQQAVGARPSQRPWRRGRSRSAANTRARCEEAHRAVGLPAGAAARDVGGPAWSGRHASVRAAAASAASAPRSRASPCTHGPHWPALSPASQREHPRGSRQTRRRSPAARRRRQPRAPRRRAQASCRARAPARAPRRARRRSTRRRAPLPRPVAARRPLEDVGERGAERD